MKRLLAFVVLLCAGVALMLWAIGGEDAVRAKRTDEEKRAQQPSTAPGVPVGQGGLGASVTQSGRLEITRRRDVPLPDGRIRKEDVYTLVAEQSTPIGEGLQQLDGVTLKVFDDGAPAATLVAERAFVELGRDEGGRLTIDEQKEIDLRSAVVTAEPGSRLAGLRLDLGDCRVHVLDEELVLNTGPNQAVRLELAGDRPATLTGLGAKARLPRTRGQGLRRADVEILRDPKLVTDDLEVRAKGRLRYVEDTASGAALVTLEQAVELDLARAGFGMPGVASSGDSGRSSVRGDQFTGWLVRTESGDGDKRRGDTDRGWQRLVLVGSPATVDVPGLRVETPRLTVLPGPLGDPFAITAHGGESRVIQTELRAGSKQTDPVVGVSPRRIHLVRPGDSSGALHRALGFPRWTLRSLDQQQVVVFEKASRLESGARTVRATDGLMVIRRLDGETGIVQGFGEIEVRQRGERDGKGVQRPDLVAHGSDGLHLVVGEAFERLRIGPGRDEGSARWREHRFDVAQGTAKLQGKGTCVVDKQGERVTLALDAPFDEIAADFPLEGVELRSVRQLRAALIGEQLEALDVAGLPTRATLVRGDESVLAQAPRMLQIGPRSLRLLPMPADESPWSELAELDRTPHIVRTWQEAGAKPDAPTWSIEVFGPRIDLHHAGGRNVVVEADADGDELPRVYARLPQSGQAEPTTLTCAAERLRVLPFVIPPELLRFHAGGRASQLDALHFHSVGRPWLLVDRVHDFQLDDPQQGHVEGTGERLFVTQGGAAALFVGDADTQRPATVRRTLEGRTIGLDGARVRMFRDDAVRLVALGSFEDRSVFLAPTLTLHEPGKTGLLSHMRAMCRGNIQVDPDAVRYDGPVFAQSVRPDGSDDPEGLRIEAEGLTMKRFEGRVVNVLGKQVKVDWTRLAARAAEVELDLRTTRCTARDAEGARVDLPDGRTLLSRRIEVNYETLAVSMGPGRIVQRDTRPEGER